MTTPPPPAPPAPTPPAPPAPPQPTPPAPPAPPPPGPQPGPPGGGGQSEAELRAALAAERRDRAAVQKQLDDLRRSGQTDQERAVADARAEGEAIARKALGKDRARDRFIALAAGKVAEPDKMAGMIDLSVAVGDDGTVDEAKLTAMVEQLAKTAPAAPAGPVRVPAGPQNPAASPGDADFLGQGLRGGQ